VTPAHERALEVLYRLLDELGVQHYALFVVPHWHGDWPLDAHPSFAARLRDHATRGATIFLHGLRHDEVGLPRTLSHRLRTFGRTDREAEFASLPPVEARARIDQGLATLRRSGLEPIGFVPPAWLPAPHLTRVVSEAGLALTEDGGAIVVNGRRIAAPATCWSTRNVWRRAGSVVVAAARLRLERTRPLLRLALHPPDAAWPGVLDSCRRTLARQLEQRVAIGYRELLSLKPISSMSPRPSRSRTAAEVSADSSRSRPPT
jgi:uncharacterized protein